MANHYFNSIIDNHGRPILGAIIYVSMTDSAIIPYATVYSDDGITAVDQSANPITTDSRGFFEFWTDETSVCFWIVYGATVQKKIVQVPTLGEEFVEGTAASVGLKSNASAIGISATDSNMGSFTGVIIPSGQTAKQAIQLLSDSATTGGLFLQSGTGAVIRTGQAARRDMATPEDFGAAGNGSTDDSAKFFSAISSKANLMLSAARSYAISNVGLSNSQSIIGNNRQVSAYTGATNIFTMANYNPALADVYVSSNLNSSGAAIRVKASRYVQISRVKMVNGGYGFMNFTVDAPASEAIALPTITDCDAEGITGVGVNVGQNVSEMRVTAMHIQGKFVTGTGGGTKPTPGSVGWRQNMPLSGSIARGGHQFSRINCIGFETGWHFTDVELIEAEGLIADSCSGFGMVFDGTGSGNGSSVNLYNAFIGTTRGYRGAGTSNVSINNLTTKFNGVIPPWGSTDFYTGTGYDVSLEDTAKLTITGRWQGDKKLNIASTAKLVVDCGQKFRGRSVGTVAAGSTTYMYEAGAVATEGDAVWRAPFPGRIIGVTVLPVAAPGASQTFSYNLRKNFADAGFSVVLSGASAFGGDTWSPTAGVAFASGDQIAMQLVTSAGAAVTRHSMVLHFVAD